MIVYIALCSAPNGKRIVTASCDKRGIWDAATGQPISEPHDTPVADKRAGKNPPPDSPPKED
jgi:hypothetical protein